MSIARVKYVKKARKDQGKCGKCGTEIKVGDSYLWYQVGFRSRWKKVRCSNFACKPKTSDLESRSGVATIYAAIEDFQDQNFENAEDMQDAFEEVKAAFNDYVSECEEALYSWEHGNSMLEERRDMAEEANSEIESFQASTDVDDDLSDEDREEALSALKDEYIEAADIAIGNL